MMCITSSVTERLKQEYEELKSNPLPYIVAEPVVSNILEWYYVIIGPKDSLYDGGYYLGRLEFFEESPLKPPSIYMLTPNGRFKTDTRITPSDFQHDSWHPFWSLSTVLKDLLSFMLQDECSMTTVETSDSDKRVLAAQSLDHILHNEHFYELFPNHVENIKGEIEKQKLIKVNVEKQDPMQELAEFCLSLIIFIIFGYLVKSVVLDLKFNI